MTTLKSVELMYWQTKYGIMQARKTIFSLSLSMYSRGSSSRAFSPASVVVSFVKLRSVKCLNASLMWRRNGAGRLEEHGMYSELYFEMALSHVPCHNPEHTLRGRCEI